MLDEREIPGAVVFQINYAINATDRVDDLSDRTARMILELPYKPAWRRYLRYPPVSIVGIVSGDEVGTAEILAGDRLQTTQGIVLDNSLVSVIIRVGLVVSWPPNSNFVEN